MFFLAIYSETGVMLYYAWSSFLELGQAPYKYSFLVVLLGHGNGVQGAFKLQFVFARCAGAAEGDQVGVQQQLSGRARPDHPCTDCNHCPALGCCAFRVPSYRHTQY